MNNGNSPVAVTAPPTPDEIDAAGEALAHAIARVDDIVERIRTAGDGSALPLDATGAAFLLAASLRHNAEALASFSVDVAEGVLARAA